ncbi:leucyl/phenylalanyl-tRNA--protein transferase [Mesoterricola sediminis]|uniref:Leucyl/phenylalanyl-tRNA--protein transferase n=1 Tax=Mesoterricola sediminis TaxID=2927980 RepID=A0AA48GUD2_9BACT|nr:leucyl/phenylalanyl-tRNA--protein transferase [Mesoterricola sediminis]BDU76394.1 leucyl/phenylalanyl-tRNA--protein transferase [Mesoterricola sediminis]
MPVFALAEAPVFPDPRRSAPDGLLAVGGDLSVERLVQAYALGIFPWYGEGSPILWWSPPERAVFLPGDGRLPRSARKALARRPFEIRRDTRFAEVIAQCARVPRAGQDGTWITEEMEAAYGALHAAGYAHSFEAYRDGELMGGLYGVSLGAAFFGESMFSLEAYASRAAFQALLDTLAAWNFQLVDGQVPNANLETLGARTISRAAFLDRLARALQVPTRRGSWAE